MNWTLRQQNNSPRVVQRDVFVFTISSTMHHLGETERNCQADRRTDGCHNYEPYLRKFNLTKLTCSYLSNHKLQNLEFEFDYLLMSFFYNNVFLNIRVFSVIFSRTAVYKKSLKICLCISYYTKKDQQIQRTSDYMCDKFNYCSNCALLQIKLD